MKNLKRLGGSITLLCLLTMSAFAGETNSPPCAPGETNSPPCLVAQTETHDNTTDNQTVPTVSGENSDYSINDVTLDLLQTVLSLY